MSDVTWEQVSNGIYEGVDFARWRNPQMDSWIIRRAHALLPEGGRILDIGCGDGHKMLALSSIGNVVGVDICDTQLEKARARGLKVFRCNIDTERLPFPDGHFDLIVSSEVIEHVLVPDHLLREARRVMKPDGHFLLTTPNLAGLGKRLMLLCGINPFIECSPLEPGAVGHLRYYIKSTLDAQLRRCGLKAVEWTSDTINFDGKGRVHSDWLARMFPTFGRSIMCVVRRA